MKIIVTGALGHIGSHLIRRLPDFFPGSEIVMLDNLSTQRYCSLFKLPTSANYVFHEVNLLTTDKDLTKIFNGASVVFHLAAITDAAASFEKADEVEFVNYNLTKVVSTACLKANVPMVLASSTSVYGTQNSQVDEFCSEDELKPQSPYAKTKLKEESLIHDLVQKQGLKALIFRFGTIFGTSPGIRFHTAVNKFTWQAVMGIPLTIWKTAYDQKRPYLHIDDCARLMAHIVENELFDGKVYNAVSCNLTVREVVKEISSHIPSLKINFVEHEIMNQLSYEVLNSSLKDKEFVFKGNIRDGIFDTINLLQNLNYSSK